MRQLLATPESLAELMKHWEELDKGACSLTKCSVTVSGFLVRRLVSGLYSVVHVFTRKKAVRAL